MLKAYVWRDAQLQSLAEDEAEQASWFDLEAPSPDEYALVTKITGFSLPHYEDLSEIESSSRLTVDKNVLTLSLPIIFNAPDALEQTVCGFILSTERLVTIRFTSNLTFTHFAPPTPQLDVPVAPHLFVSLLEGMIDRQADRLEKLREELDGLSRRIFRRQKTSSAPSRRAEHELQRILIVLGQGYEAVSYIRDCQLGIDRIAAYIPTAVDWMPKPLRERLSLAKKDVSSLNEFSTHLTDKIQFLQDSTLGFINISQNNLIKVLTIVSIVGIPPTLIAGIYGMNFKDIPELSWQYGYGYAWAIMIFSAVAPLAWFRKKGWI